MRIRTTAAIVCIIASCFAVPTAALDDSDSDSFDEIQLTPASEAATIEDGELALDFDRLNADATTTTHDVFTVSADAGRDIWIEHDLDGVTFYADESPENVITASNPLRLEPGDTQAIGVEIDTRTAASGAQTFTIATRAPDESPGGPGLPPGGPEIPTDPPEDGNSSEPPVEPVPSRLSVTAVTIDRATVTVGETVSASATVSNNGSEPIEEVLGVAVNGVLLDDRLVSVAPGEQRSVTFTWRVPREGAYVTSIGGVETSPVFATNPDAPAFDVFELASPHTVALTPPVALGLLVIGSMANRRRS